MNSLMLFAFNHTLACQIKIIYIKYAIKYNNIVRLKLIQIIKLRRKEENEDNKEPVKKIEKLCKYFGQGLHLTVFSAE